MPPLQLPKPCMPHRQRKSKPPKINGKYASTAPVIELQPILLQWITFKRNEEHAWAHQEHQAQARRIFPHIGQPLLWQAWQRQLRKLKKTFVHNSLRIKTLLTTSKPVKTDERAADIYAVIAKKQENRICLLDELKDKLTMEVTAIAQEEVKALVWLCAFD